MVPSKPELDSPVRNDSNLTALPRSMPEMVPVSHVHRDRQAVPGISPDEFQDPQDEIVAVLTPNSARLATSQRCNRPVEQVGQVVPPTCVVYPARGAALRKVSGNRVAAGQRRTGGSSLPHVHHYPLDRITKPFQNKTWGLARASR